MVFFKAAVAASLLAAASAQPIATLPGVPVVNGYGLSPLPPQNINGQEIHASNGEFWVGKPTTTLCPVDEKLCPKPGNKTAFTVLPDGTMWMDTVVPGGQQLFVTPKGVVSYTKPHSAAMPQGYVSNGFRIVISGGGLLVIPPGSWKICPDSKGRYQLFMESHGKTLRNEDVPSGNAEHCLLTHVQSQALPGFGTSAYEYL
ncbi:hypothetical protein TWF694_011402 [Orbilia ellipsospora]|uniref:Uncharacterized protein n=1 Tax=Orbilia ellipsospora TaxID=2528407 RepID=A0AAV9X570_9PEZI